MHNFWTVPSFFGELLLFPPPSLVAPGLIQNKNAKVVGGWTKPFETDARQIGSFPQVGMKMKEILKPPPRCVLFQPIYLNDLSSQSQWRL